MSCGWRTSPRPWRIVYRVDPDAVLILEVFKKKSQKTPEAVIRTCKARLRAYDQIAHEK